MILNDGKGCWFYACLPCKEVTEAFGEEQAAAYGQSHEQTAEHAHVMIGIAFKGVRDGLMEKIKPALELINEIFAPPTNKPHDPDLLRDRRKWGGR